MKCVSNTLLLHSIFVLSYSFLFITLTGRKLLVEPEWTKVGSSLKQTSIIDYIILDEEASRKASDVVHVDTCTSDIEY